MSKNSFRITNKDNSEAVNVVLFYKYSREASSTIAWKVITNLEVGETRQIDYDDSRILSVEDACGNCLGPRHARAGEQYAFFKKDNEVKFEKVARKKVNYNTIEVLNRLEQGSISPKLLINNQMAARKENIVPEQKAVFIIKNDVYLGIDKTKSIEQGDLLTKGFLDGSISKYNLYTVSEIEV